MHQSKLILKYLWQTTMSVLRSLLLCLATSSMIKDWLKKKRLNFSDSGEHRANLGILHTNAQLFKGWVNK